MAQRRAKYTDRAIELMATMGPTAAFGQLQKEGFEVSSVQVLHDLKYRTGLRGQPFFAVSVDASAVYRPEWEVPPIHRASVDAMNLRLLARRMQGLPLGPDQANHVIQSGKLDRWLLKLAVGDLVVTYDGGWKHVPRRYWNPAPGVRRPIDEFILDPSRNDDGTVKVIR